MKKFIKIYCKVLCNVLIYACSKETETKEKEIESMKQMNKTNWEVERKQLEEMPFDKRFDGELCHATGYAVKDEYGDWWNEYVSSEGILCYGR